MILFSQLTALLFSRLRRFVPASDLPEDCRQKYHSVTEIGKGEGYAVLASDIGAAAQKYTGLSASGIQQLEEARAAEQALVAAAKPEACLGLPPFFAAISARERTVSHTLHYQVTASVLQII